MRTAIIALLFVFPASAAEPKAKRPPVTGEPQPALAEIDTLILETLGNCSCPGAAVAVAKDGRLVYARGFGYAEPERKTPVQPTAMFRLASASKPITLAAVCQLVERGKLDLDARVFDLLKLKAPEDMDPRWKTITVRHLSVHAGGFDSSVDGDPSTKSVEIARQFKVPPPAKPEHIIRHMLARPLDFDPGSKVVYSNFGYLLLGRVVQAAGGKPYEKYVVEELLRPLGVRHMQLGKTLSTAKGEVRYFENDPPRSPSVFAGSLGHSVPTPYGGWCLESMDSQGGWIASAVDLARFGSALDQPERFPAVKGQSFKLAFFPEYFHYGAFSGTSALFQHGPDGLSYAVLFNGRKAQSDKELAPEIHDRLKKILASVKQWPEEDLFAKYLK